MADFDGRRRLATTLDAVQEISHVVVARVILFGPLNIRRPFAFWRQKKVLGHIFYANNYLGPFKWAPDRVFTGIALDTRPVGVLKAEKRVSVRVEQTPLRQIVGIHVFNLSG